jgi:ankyrin repeat protein
MVAAMKGNTDTVKKILDYEANPNLVDMHGTSALYEATRSGHEATMDILLESDGTLCMDEAQAAGKLCETVFNGDILSLRRLLRAKIQVNAGDYDKRTCAHIAAAEGNLPAMKLLVEYGADLKLVDRWGNTIFGEAKRVNENQLLDYLEEVEHDEAKNE